MKILAVTGLAREVKIVSGPDIAVVAGGGDSKGLREKIEGTVDSATRGIISIGIAGALDPALRVGHCIVASEIVGNKGRIATDRRWSERISLRLPEARSGSISGSGTIVARPEEKAAKYRDLRALSVDMESHIAAEAASACGLPFAALRVISDSAAHVLPQAALVAMRPDGGIALGRVLRSLLAEPSQLPHLMRTARDAEIAFAALLRCRDLLGLGLACPYLG